MRSSRLLPSLRSPRRLGIYQLPRARSHTILRNGYCSACETPEAPTDHLSPKPELKLSPDHRELAKQQQLFTTSIYSPGSPLFLPHGTRLFNKLTKFLRDQYEDFGFEEVITPTIYKKSLWKLSGHWENYADDMYSVTGRGASGKGEGELQQDEEYGLKPMNCPGHCLLFASRARSYKELPIRYADFSALHRNEIHGALSGLTRLRRFHQDDGHIFCRPSQIQEEITRTLDFVELAYKVLDLGPYRLCLSTRPADHFIGTVEEWDNAETALKASLDASGQQWTLNEGDGAFYGPKIDIVLKDSDGKEHQTATIQLDFQLPKRFGLEYSAPAAELEQKGLTTTDADLLGVEGKVTPVLIHRAVLGSVERMMALLIERYNGKYPFWLSPRQVLIITLNNTEPVVEYAKQCKRIIQGLDERTRFGAARSGERITVDIETTPQSLSKNIKAAKEKGYPVIAVVGPRDIEKNQVIVDLSGLYNPDDDLQQLREMFAEKDLVDGDGAMTRFTMEPDALRMVLEDLQLDHR